MRTTPSPPEPDRRSRRSEARIPVMVLALGLATIVIAGSAGAQEAISSGDPFTRVGLLTEPHLEMSTLMEVTIFNIDVLTLTVRVPPETAQRLSSLVHDGSDSEVLADSVAAVMLEADLAWARQVLHRDVGLGRLLGGIRETMEKGVEAGYVTPEYFEESSRALPELFAFLEEEGASEGDEIFFEIRDGMARTLYRSVEGELLLDRSTEGSQAQRASIASFFAPDTRFREGLIESLIESVER